MKIVLYQPDIAQNTGSFIRLCACIGCELHVIEPCGFIWDEKKIARVAMDYLPLVKLVRHLSFEAFLAYKEALPDARLIVLTTKTDMPYTHYHYKENDFLLCGRESSGVPESVHQRADARVTIPMQPDARSLNVVNAASMVLGEAMRQAVWTRDAR